MIKIEAYIREEKFEDVKEAVSQIEVHGITVYQVMGCGIQKGYTEIVRGNEIEVNILPKIKFEIIVSDQNSEAKTIAAIKKAVMVGKMLFIMLLNCCPSIGFGKKGNKSISSR